MLIFLSEALEMFIVFDSGTRLQRTYPKEILKYEDIHSRVTCNRKMEII